MTLDELVAMIANDVEYKKLDENGKALGCFLPVYMLYPKTPREEWPKEDSTFAETVLSVLKKNGHQITREEIQPGDVVAFRMPFGFIHVGVYMGDDWIVHCMTGETMERFRFSFAERRIEGIFRWTGGED